MAKKKSTLGNMLIALLVITAVAGGLLGLVFSITNPKIEKEKDKKNKKAIEAVLPLDGVIVYSPDTLVLTANGDTTTFPCSIARDSISKAFKGIAIKTSEGGFGGKIELMVGITADDTIRGVSVLSHSETPGLGANMDKVLVDQFANKKPGETFSFAVTKKKEKGMVDAITAATITSNAFTKAVGKAYEAYETNKDCLAGAAPASGDTPQADETMENTEENKTEEANENKEGGTNNE